MKRNILLIGGGGREHALACKIAESPLLGKLYGAPSSDAMQDLAEKIDIAVHDYQALVAWCKNNAIHLVIIGPEQPLADGLADLLREADIAVFGPNAKPAMLESSKIWMKNFLQKYQIPTARFACFDDVDLAKKYVREQYKSGYANASNQGVMVVKSDGLAAGKGVVIASDEEATLLAIDEAMQGKFGDAGKKLVIEEFMAGEEISWFAISDGKMGTFLGTAQDYKRAFDNHQGANTGGMGAFSPALQETETLNKEIDRLILQPLIQAMALENIPYHGILFFGIMLTEQGAKVIEINIRMGDPECQVLMPRLNNDVIVLFEQTAKGMLQDEVQLDETVALTVVMASKGYPESYQKGSQIKGLEQALSVSDDGTIYHAGTKLQDGFYHANGGRVLNIVAKKQQTLKDARLLAYQMIDKIDWAEGFFRRDIGL